MQLYDLDTKLTKKSNEILNFHIGEQKELSLIRINEIRNACKNILEKNGIFEDRKNCSIYHLMERELKKLENNIMFLNQNNLEDITRYKIDNSIENVTAKLESLSQNLDFSLLDDDYSYNKAYDENNVRNMLFSYFESYKANTVELLLENGYSQNTIDNIEEDILEYTTSKNSDILTEKISQDGFKNMDSLSKSLDKLEDNILIEAEARYNCDLTGTVYDELKEKRDFIREKAKIVNNLIRQINGIDLKSSQIS